MVQLGFKIDARPAEDVIALSRAVEARGCDQVWFCEDLGLAGGIAQVSAALSADAGADHVVLQPISGREEEQIAAFGEHVIPVFTTSSAASRG